jgi:hypothetical protein
MALPASKLAQQRLHVLHDPLEAAGPQPALHLLVRRRPRRKIMRHQPPLISGLHNVTHRVEQSPQIMLPRRIVRATQ